MSVIDFGSQVGVFRVVTGTIVCIISAFPKVVVDRLVLSILALQRWDLVIDY